MVHPVQPYLNVEINLLGDEHRNALVLFVNLRTERHEAEQKRAKGTGPGERLQVEL